MALPTPSVVLLEKVHSMPSQGVKSTFSFGEAFGWIQGVLDALNLPVRLITPNEWQKPLNVGIVASVGATRHKQALKGIAQERCPMPTAITNDMADAMLIADYAFYKFVEKQKGDRFPFD
jgi:crossover junction endodeoxyribonuclease RuvC